jgi:deoxyribonuclease V
MYNGYIHLRRAFMFTPKIVDFTEIKSGAILAIDVDYRDDHAVASGVLFQDWTSSECAVINTRVENVAPYEPGSFWKRELPCIHKLLLMLDVLVPDVKLSCIVIDGYVFLDDAPVPKWGLGGYLNNSLGGEIPIIGVAKTHFHGVPENTRVFRPNSMSPLYVTATGLDLNQAREEAKKNIESMHGTFRLPSMLKFVDQCCRNYKGET